MSVRNVIALFGPPIFNEDDKAAAEIIPGMLVGWDANGDLVPHSDAGAPATARNFALERDEMGMGIDDPYAIGDQVKVGAFHQGQRVYAWLASGQNVSKGDELDSDGQGMLVAGTAAPVGRALEDTDASDGDTRIRVEVI